MNEHDDLIRRLREQRIPNWIQSTGETPRQNGMKQCPLCQEAATALESAKRVPPPGSPEANAMVDSVLAEYGWPCNPKNAARAGFEAASRYLSAHRIGAEASPPPLTGWRPIETAPKDGTHVLVVTVNNMVRTARWSSHRCRWLVAYDENYSATSDHDPTHWQPLPAPLSIGAEGQEG